MMFPKLKNKIIKKNKYWIYIILKLDPVVDEIVSYYYKAIFVKNRPIAC